MKIVGIIVEYNPLHNGHLYHINETKKRSKCDYLIAVMSGNFVMRGEPAILNKHIRTNLALKSGIDLVVELPYQYSVASADIFANGAIQILNHLSVSEIYFGSESDNHETLTHVANTIDTHEFNKELKNQLDLGLAYPKACELTLKSLKVDYQFNANDILGIQYIRSILKLNPKINYYTIKRLHSQYNDPYFSHESIASATSIRNAIYQNKTIKNYVPEYTHESLKKQKLVSWNDFYPYLKYQILVNQSNLHSIHDVNEGIENKIIANINKFTDFNEFVDSLVSRRYTQSKIKRMLTHILNNVTKDEIDFSLQAIRILGVHKNKTHILKSLNCTLPLITNINKSNFEMIRLDEKISELYHLIDGNHSRKIPVFSE